MQAPIRSTSEWHSSRVLLSGDSPLMRTALGHLLSVHGIAPVDECANHPEAVGHAVRSGIDLLVMDFELDSTRLTHTVRFEQLLSAAHGCPVLVVTQTGDHRAIVGAFQRGVAGVVLKSRPADVFMRAIRAVLAGGAWMERSTVASVFDTTVTTTERLTPRETEVVELVTLGLKNKKIAERLSIAENTVRHHLTSIFDKLAVTNRMELMRHAYGDQRGD